MYDKLKANYAELAKFYSFDQAKYPYEQFFSNLKSFRDSFQVRATYYRIHSYFSINTKSIEIKMLYWYV